jgi:DNA-damage-inducible protein J
MRTDTFVRARIDRATKERAAHILAAMGLSISDGIRLFMMRVVEERRLPFDVKAIAEVESGKGKSLARIATLMADLDAED